MTSLDTSIAFFAVSLLLAYTPGPDNLFVLVQSVTRGRKAGFCIVLGLCTGLLVHTAAVALGLAAVFAASATAFTVLKFVGSAYLAYLGWQAWIAPAAESPSADLESPDLLRMYGRGVIMNLTNPKVVVFFLAFLPQFVRTGGASVVLQLVWLGFLFILATIVAFGSIAYFAAAVGQALRRSARVQRALNRAAAVVFLGLAASLAITVR